MSRKTENEILKLDTPAIGPVLNIATHRLRETTGEPARLEAEILLAHTVGKERSFLWAWPEALLDPGQIRAYVRLLERRMAGEPIAYITGHQEFWSLDLRVTPETLIPRADTETMVEHALGLIPADRPCRVADLGTGSGAIAAALASERPRCRVVATDDSEETLAVAKENFERLGLRNVSCRIGAWCDALPRGVLFDIILSNPPYVPADAPHLRMGDLPWEPRKALTPGPEGLESIRAIVRDAPRRLVPGGHLLLEHGFDQGERVRELLKTAGFQAVETHRDLEGRPRVTRGRTSRQAR